MHITLPYAALISATIVLSKIWCYKWRLFIVFLGVTSGGSRKTNIIYVFPSHTEFMIWEKYTEVGVRFYLSGAVKTLSVFTSLKIILRHKCLASCFDQTLDRLLSSRSGSSSLETATKPTPLHRAATISSTFRRFHHVWDSIVTTDPGFWPRGGASGINGLCIPDEREERGMVAHRLEILLTNSMTKLHCWFYTHGILRLLAGRALGQTLCNVPVSRWFNSRSAM